jgi:hypothetical protein
MKSIQIDPIKQQRIGSVLQKIAAKGDFTFAYNNRAIPADSLISLNGYQGTIYDFLNNTFGSNYEFKEVPGYIVLRHAPNKMNLSIVLADNQGQQMQIKGHVVNAHDQQGLPEVSVYEKNQLVSALTDENGDFEMKIPDGRREISLTATKETYRDTTLFLLSSVNINATASEGLQKKTKRRYKYYPDAAVNKFRRGFGRLFISSKQTIQDLNLGDFFAYSPYQVSLTPGLSSHGLYNSQVIDHFSLNVIGGYTAGVQGVEIAGVFNIDRTDVSWLQMAGLFNSIGGDMRGFQTAGLFNEVFGKVDGLQIAGVVNVADRSAGLQLAGICNISGDIAGLQISTLFNRAKKVKGIQFAGLFNIADSSDYPIAVINFIKNGKKSIAISLDELNFVHIDYRSGGRVLYGLIGTGYKFIGNSPGYAFDIGFGAHIKRGTVFSIDAEYGYEAISNFKNDPDQLSSFRLLPALRLTKNLQLFAGPTFDLAFDQPADPLKLNGWHLHDFGAKNDRGQLYIGILGGLQFIW